MARSWQLWLSPRPLRRTVTFAQPTILYAHDAALYEFLEEKDGRLVIRETHYIDNPLVRDGLSGPALYVDPIWGAHVMILMTMVLDSHIHLLQNEYFQVEQGVIAVSKNGKQTVATKDDGILEIPAGTRHQFWAHKSNTEDLVFKVWAQPQDLDHGFDERFIRNLVGYLRDCSQANMKPSPFQLILFSYSSATVGTPPFWLPTWLLVLVNYVLAYWVGAVLLGYQDSYPEYYRETEGRSERIKKLL